MLQKDYEMTYLTKTLKPEYLGTVGLCEYVLGDGRNIVWLSLTGLSFLSSPLVGKRDNFSSVYVRASVR